MANVKPFEVIAGPAKVFFAATGTAFPDIDTPATLLEAGGTWKYFGLTEGGVKAAHPQTIVELRADQVTGPIKAVRSEEGQEITFALAELTLENYAAALNQAIAGPTTSGDVKIVKLYRGGSQVETLALLVRGEHLSPYGDFNLQYEVPVVFQADPPETDYVKDNKAVLATSWHTIVDPDRSDDSESFGVLRAATA